jgi:HK97 family phage major capsid protein
MTLKELREKRKKLITSAREIIDFVDKENREMTKEESTNYDKLFGEADELRQRIAREERQREAERELEESMLAEDEKRRREKHEQSINNLNDDGRQHEERDRVMECFKQYLMYGPDSIRDIDGAEEFRSLSAGVNTEGGYIVTPQTFIRTLIKGLDDDVIIRRLATTYEMNSGDSIGAPSLDSDPDDADWTDELSTGTEDSKMAFGKRVMEGHPMAKRIKVSRKLLRVAALGAEALVRSRLQYKFAITQEKAYLTGSGNKRPLGLFTASNDGIPTSRDVSTANTSTGPTMDGLKNAKYSLKAGYWPRSSWLFHRDVVREIAKLKDGEGRYLWAESVREGEPDRLLGRPAYMSEYAPNTLTTGQYIGIVGDFSKYWIFDSLMMQLQRLDELYAEKNQVGFIGRYEGDGAPVLAEAFARIQLT